ncbi:MAG: hypothetical protein WAL29_04190 [Bacteroidales bacterium]
MTQNIYRLCRGAESFRLLEQWFNADPYSRTRVTEGLCIPEDSVSSKVNEENRRHFKNCNVLGTPTFFVNGYKLPSQYEIDDFKYFREIFTEKQELSVK